MSSNAVLHICYTGTDFNNVSVLEASVFGWAILGSNQ